MARIALVTSGLGNAFGGVGVVASAMHEALGTLGSVQVWFNRLDRERGWRVAALAAQTLSARPQLLVYDHMNLARLSVVLPWLRHVPYVVFLHGTEVWRALDPLHRRALSRATLLIANSQFTVDAARALNPWLPRTQVTWLGVRAPDRHDDAERGPNAVIVGRMHPTERQKGHDLILETWPELEATIPDASLLIVGDGDDRERLERKARDLGLRRARFVGRVSDAERDAIYRKSRLFLFPSTQEGFGLAAVEAAFSATPILALKRTVLEELFPHSTGAVFAEAATARDVARAAAPVLSDPSIAEALGRRASEHARRHYRHEDFIARFREAVRGLTGSAPKTRQ